MGLNTRWGYKRGIRYVYIGTTSEPLVSGTNEETNLMGNLERGHEFNG